MRRLLTSLLLLLLLFGFWPAVSIGKNGSWPEWNPAVRLDFGKCLYSEDSSGTDWSALGWSLIKQWRLRNDGRFADYSFHKQVRWYCAVFERNGPQWLGKRSGRILTATWERAPYEREMAAWGELRGFVDKFERREVADPCPSCVWWGGPSCDTIPDNWVCPLGPDKTGWRYRKNSFCHLVGTPGR